MTRSAACSVVGSLLLLSACNDPAPRMDRIDDNVSAAYEKAAAAQDEAETANAETEKLETRIGELEERLDALEAADE